jgi:hypothetical protein
MSERAIHSAEAVPPQDAERVDAGAPPPKLETVEKRHGAERRSSLDRRRGPGRRRTDYRRAAEEGHMNEEQVDFLRAIDEYKRVNHRPFPTWTEVLDIVLYLGYRRVAPVGEFKLSKGRQTPLPGGGTGGSV